MNDGILSQEEIDALLKGNSSNQNLTDNSNSSLGEFEKDTLGEIGNITMGTAATTLSTLLQKKVAITTPDVSITTEEQLQNDYPLPYLVIEVEYTQGLNGTNILVIKEEDACIIANLMMGGPGQSDNKTLGELELSAVGEAMNQMMGSATTSLSSMFNRRIDIAPPRLTIIDLGKDKLELASKYKELIRIQFKMEIEHLVNSEIMQIIPLEAVDSMVGTLLGNNAETTEPQTSSVSAINPETAFQEVASEDYRPAAMQDNRVNAAYSNNSTDIKKDIQYTVQPVQFAHLKPNETENKQHNIDLIMDVPLNITVELGKARKTIKEILELHQGSIIQLDKLAGEPVDMLVNGQLIAKGEVVVIDESYGIRITTIISPRDRINQLQ
ncbi:MAG: flagellar motor switch phosphatase FliY [Syntrophomonadaceae bacterium]